MAGYKTLFALLALGSFLSAAQAAVDVVFFIDGASYLNGGRWSTLQSALAEFISSNTFTGSSYSVFVLNFGNGFVTFAGPFDANAGLNKVNTDLSTIAITSSTTFSDNHWIDWGFGRLRGEDNANFQSSQVILISDFNYGTSSTSSYVTQINNYFQSAGISDGRILALQIVANSGVSNTNGELLAQQVGGIKRPSPDNAALSWTDVTSANLERYYAEFTGQSSVTPAPPPSGTPAPPGPPGQQTQTDPPLINAPELENFGCLEAADVVFLIDASSSIIVADGGSDRYWKMQLSFVQDIVAMVKVSNQEIRVGIVVFADDVQQLYHLNDQQTNTALKNRIDTIPFLGGTTETGNGIVAAQELLREFPRGVPEIILIITDGVPNQKDTSTPWEEASSRAKEEYFITIVTFGIGPFIDAEVLEEMASSGSLSANVRNFDDLQAIVPTVHRLAFCDVTFCPALDIADILIIIPVNDETLLNRVKEFVTGLINTFRLEQNNSPYVNQAGSRVALIAMERTPRVVATLDANLNYANRQTVRQTLISRLAAIQFDTDAPSNLQASLQLAYDNVFIPNGDRPSARNLIVLITQVLTGGSPVAIATQLKEDKEAVIMPIQYAVSNPDLQVTSVLESIQTIEPQDGGKTLYRSRSINFDTNHLTYYSLYYMQAACEAMTWTMVPPIQALKGAIGDTGEQGLKGFQGIQGPKGEPGAAGSSGRSGIAGSPGNTGQKGDRGDSGGAGNKGERGPSGQKGDKGERGSNGAFGNPGSRGADGQPGDKGNQGPQGAQGLPGAGQPGPSGDKGERGINGANGGFGANGLKGQKGFSGIKGASGAAGVKGLPGSPGANGAPGRTGEKGSIGPAGRNGVGIPGIVGDKGDIGFDGIPGNPGSAGLPGFSGDVGDPGFDGGNGAKGAKGQRGSNGIPGSAGLPGEKGEPGLPGQTSFGLKGDKGQVGDQGNQGRSGNPGINGRQGAPGDQGFQGGPGARGNPGFNGGQGFPGVKGNKGESGAAGEPGLRIPGFRGDNGDAGRPGVPGIAGSIGLPGINGPVGQQGPNGNRGPQGGVGEPGDNGARGLPGDPGSPGAPGSPGFGESGDRGSNGIAGVPGSNGRDGNPGGNGANGLKGRKGTLGRPGLNGSPGAPGLSGSPGAKGTAGLNGAKGDRGDAGFGLQGDRGDPGVRGRDGVPGRPGSNGSPGAKGEPGIPGINGVNGQPGNKGDRGDNGDFGIPGQQGSNGFPGSPGQKGESGNPGSPGRNGVSGQQGEFGEIGVQGRPGDRGPVGAVIAGQQGIPGFQGPQGPPGPPGPPGNSYVDECKINNGGCHHLCVSLFFSQYCACRDGYELVYQEQPFCPDIARPGFNGAGVEIAIGGAGIAGGQFPTFPTSDVVFAIDVSDRSSNFDELRRFLSNVVDQMNIVSTTTRIAVVGFDRLASVLLPYQQGATSEAIRNSIQGLQTTGFGPADVSRGMDEGRRYLEDNIRPDAARLLVVFSYGNDQISNAQASVNNVLSSGIPIIIGNIGLVPTNLQNVREVNLGPMSQIGTSFGDLLQEMQRSVGLSLDLVEPPTSPGACSQRLDIAFIVDASSSMMTQNKDRNMAYIRLFLEKFVNNLGISYSGVRVSFIVFSNTASVRMTLDQTWNLQQVISVIKKLEYIGGDTNIAAALRAAYQVIFTRENGDRPDVNNLAILITDQRDNIDQNLLQQETQRLRGSAEIMAIGVTNRADMEELRSIASVPGNAIFIDQYEELTDAIDGFLERACSTASYFPRADIAILVQTSNPNNLDQIFRTLNDIRFGGGADVRVGLVVFGSEARVVIPLDANLQQVFQNIRNGDFNVGGTPNMQAALEELMMEFFVESAGDRLEVPNIVLAFIDDTNTDVSTILPAANSLRTHGIAVVAIGVGSGVNNDLLSTLSYQPDFAVNLQRYENLPNSADTIDRAARVAVGAVYVPHWRPYMERNQLCFDTGIHGIQCFCWSTLESMNSSMCINVDECCKNNGGCSHMCTDTEGSYFCGCPEGLELSEDGHTCVDIDECPYSPCDGDGECLNTYKGYECLYDINRQQLVGGAEVGVIGATVGTNTLVGATIATAVGTVLLMVLIAAVARRLRGRDADQMTDDQVGEPSSVGHDNLGFSGKANATMKASSRAFDTVSASGSSIRDVDSLSNFSVSNVM